jgi:hypothetical protein
MLSLSVTSLCGGAGHGCRAWGDAGHKNGYSAGNGVVAASACGRAGDRGDPSPAGLYHGGVYLAREVSILELVVDIRLLMCWRLNR